MEKARSDPEAARQLLLFHATQGRILSNGISDGQVRIREFISVMWCKLPHSSTAC